MIVKQISILNFRGIRNYEAEFQDGVVVIDDENSDAIMSAIDIVTSGEGLDALSEDALITAQVQTEDGTLFVTAEQGRLSAYCAFDDVTDLYRQMISDRAEERKQRFYDGHPSNCLAQYRRGEILPSESEVGSLNFFCGTIGRYLRHKQEKENKPDNEPSDLQAYRSFIDTQRFWDDYKKMQNFRIEMQPVFVSNLLSRLHEERQQREIFFLSATMHRQVFLSK